MCGKREALRRRIRSHVVSVEPVPARYRCTACGNLTRFDVTSTRRERAFHHYSIGGELTVEEREVLSEAVESVMCRWCGNGTAVEKYDALEPGTEGVSSGA
jgi:hypothetical protein